MNHKLYLLAFDKKINSWLTFREHPLHWLCAVIIKFFTQSRINHIADTYNYKNRSKFVNHMVAKGFESINHLECFKPRNCRVRAYEIIVPIDFELWHKSTHIDTKDFKFDVVGGLSSKGGEWGWSKWMFNEEKIKADKNKLFCDEEFIRKMQIQGYLLRDKGAELDRNKFSTKECIDLHIKHGLCNPNPILVWDRKFIVNNIFE